MAAPSPAETIPPALRAPAAKQLIIKMKIKKPQESAAGADPNVSRATNELERLRHV
jgi:hypothetical protein